MLAARAFLEAARLKSMPSALRRLGAAVARTCVYAPASGRARFAAMPAASGLTLEEVRSGMLQRVPGAPPSRRPLTTRSVATTSPLGQDAGTPEATFPAARRRQWQNGPPAAGMMTFVASGVPARRGCAEHDATLRKYSTDLGALDTNT
jgi:hypothetical protein